MNLVNANCEPGPLLKSIKGFEQINRYWDKTHELYVAKILPGEYYVTAASEGIVTVLGSCVSACIRDNVFGIGGMNHFMLPIQNDADASAASRFGAAERYGNVAMEHLINEILKNGGRRENLEVKIFGGGKILQEMTDIGDSNIRFIREYLKTEGFLITAEDLSDICPRKVMYFPQTGKVKLKKLRSLHNTTVVERETQYLEGLQRKPKVGEVDLF